MFFGTHPLAGRTGMMSRMGFAALASVMLACPAHTQIAPGLSGSSTTGYTTNATEFWQILRSYGNCFAKQSETEAWELIGTDPDSKEEAAVYKRMSRGTSKMCLTDTSLRAPVPLIRGAIAEGLFVKGASTPSELLQEAPQEGQPVVKLGEAARCYVASHRPAAKRLILETAPGSKKEIQALQAMSADFFDCLPEMAQKRSFNPTQVRYRLAEALLRMPADVPAAAAAVGSK